MEEKVYKFGTNRCLVGLVTEPAPGSYFGRPAFVFLNAGLLHRVGPFRLYVALARKLAAKGFLGLRFDLSGVGDSEVRRTSLSDMERCILDTREALDFLERQYGVTKVILVGLCSGADVAHYVLARDRRACSAIFLDGYGFRTLGYHVFHNLRRAKRWRQFLARKTRELLRVSSRPPRIETYVRDFPTQEEFAKDAAGFIQRGARLYYIYTSGAADYFNHRGQFRAMIPAFKGSQQVSLTYLPQADHTFSIEADRADLITLITKWTSENFPAVRQENDSTSQNTALNQLLV